MNDTATAGTATPARPIESASASTACQTSGSKTAYLITGAVLGFTTLFIMAIVVLLFTAFVPSADDLGGYPSTGYGTSRSYGYGYDDDDDDWYGYDDDWYGYGYHHSSDACRAYGAICG